PGEATQPLRGLRRRTSTPRAPRASEAGSASDRRGYGQVPQHWRGCRQRTHHRRCAGRSREEGRAPSFATVHLLFFHQFSGRLKTADDLVEMLHRYGYAGLGWGERESWSGEWFEPANIDKATA